MPLEFSSVGFETQIVRSLAAFAAIAKRLEVLARYAAEREREIAWVPQLRYAGDALAVAIEPGQRGALRIAGPTVFERIGRGLAVTPTLVRDELRIGTLLGMVSRGLDALQASVDRFRRPDKTMFDSAQASDLFGLAALAARSVVKSRVTLGAGALGAYALASVFPSGGGGPSLGLAVTLRGIAEPMLQLAIGLPLFTAALMAVAPLGDHSAKAWLLGRLVKAEAGLDTLATTILEFVPRALTGRGTAWRWVEAVGTVLRWKLPEVLAFGHAWGSAVLVYVQTLFGVLQTWGRSLGRLVEQLPGVIDRIGDIELLGPILRALGHSFPAPSITLNKLAAGVADNPRKRMRSAVLGIAGAIDSDKTKAVGDLYDLVMKPAPPLGPEVGFPALAAAPDLSLPRIEIPLDGLRGLTAPLHAAATAAERASAEFAAESRRAASLGDAAQLAAIARRSREQARGLLALPVVAQPRRDPMAEAFEAAMADGGIATAGAAIGTYVGQLRRYWEASPHILAKRAQVGHVRVPRVTVRVPEGVSPEEVARRFGTAVGELYVRASA